MKWTVPYTVSWHGLATVEAGCAEEAIAFVVDGALEDDEEDDHENFDLKATEAFPVNARRS